MHTFFKIGRLFVLLTPLIGLSTNSYTSTIDFAEKIWPIFEKRCVECHGPEKQKEGLRFDDLEWLSDGELLGDGDSSESLIYEMVTLKDDDDGYMPKKRERLSAEELELLRSWLDGGADSEGWVVPEVIVIRRDRDAHLASLAEGVESASVDAMDALRELGIVAVPLADDNQLVRIGFERAEVVVEDSHLDLLSPLAGHVTSLGLANSQISDDGLSRLKSLSKLTNLDLGGTRIGDEGIAHLEGLEHIETLNLIRTQVTDDGLNFLGDLNHLKKVYAWGSQITREGADRLEENIPGLTVELGIE
ncbi:MAG: c-type cytochrome domain-containing protein [Candidatus Hydrogenedentota bacterium]